MSRTIPPNIKLQVRKRSGFGCVICGIGIVEYEHIHPEFKDCKEHKAEGITLLCPTCHSKKTRRFLSTETVKKAMLDPKARQQGFSREILDIGNRFPKIYFGGSLIKECPIPLMVSKVPVIKVLPPETKDAPFRLSAIFLDKRGEVSLEIVDNEWFAYSTNWDFEAKAGKMIISDSRNSLSLVLKTIDSETIEIELIESIIGNIHLLGNKDRLMVKHLQTGNTITYRNCFASGGSVGFSL